ncbi:cytochrome P450 3A40-like [Galendromus occidentalis]|uniref:Cytochrome P450 3A40-like n=1 Tax=Galendromus occidentalis TaxID=34638 RepID=A0AAJ6QTG5_9ACAR|nr:cytochrome P450 3A40-like [Galendromus occidentalis]
MYITPVLIAEGQRDDSLSLLGIPYESYGSYLYYFLFCEGRVDIFNSIEEYNKKYGSVYVRYKEWKLVRPLSRNVMTGSKLRLMRDQFERPANLLTSNLEELADTNEEISTAHYSHAAVMNPIAAVTFSLDIDAFDDPNNKFLESFTGFFNGSLGFNLIMAFPSILKYLPFVEYPPEEIDNYFHQFSRSLLEKRREQIRNPEELDFLDSWLESQKANPKLRDDLLISQMTISLNISDPDNVTFEDYHTMKYLGAAMWATLRLYPMDFVTDRVTSEPCTIAGVSLDKGITIHVPTCTVNKDPERFHEPSLSKPKRYLGGGEKTQES